METNPTSPNHVRALIEVSRDLAALQRQVGGALVMATDPGCYLMAADVSAIRARLDELRGRVRAFEAEARSAEGADPVRAVRVTVSDLDPAAIERLLSTACQCEPMAERARRLVR